MPQTYPCSWLEERDGIYVAYRCNKNPTILTDEFVTLLARIAVVRRRLMIERYQDIIQHTHEWFAEKGLTMDITDLEGTVAPTVLDDTNNTNDAYRNMDTLRKEVHLIKKLREVISVLPVLGFNSSAYDIPLIKKWLFPRLVSYAGGDTTRIQFVKKSINRYASLYARAGDSGLSFLDIMHYLAPGFNLDHFIRSFASSESQDRLGDKSVFPYEYIDNFDHLSETSLPPYEAFYSRLWNGNILDLDYRRFKSEGGESTGRAAPATGQEVYARLLEQWATQGWRTIGDYLRYYNIQDVGPFLEGVIAYSHQLRAQGVDMVRDAISLPGLAKHILSYVPARMLHYISNPYIYEEIRCNEVGGQSIIFTRRNDEDHPYVKGFNANSLYLYCLGEGQFVGQPIIYKEDGEYLSRAESESLQGSCRPYGRDSKEAERYLTYYGDFILHPMGVIMTRQYSIRLTRGERAALTERYATHDIPQMAVPYRLIVDGYYETTVDNETVVGLGRRQRHVIEFDGRYWHTCSCRAGMYSRRRLRGNYMLQ